MGKFDEHFSKVLHFTDDRYVVSGYYDMQEAAQLIGKYIGEDIDLSCLKIGYVRFGFVPDYVEDYEPGQACWYTVEDPTKGTKPVWAYYPCS